MLSNYLKTTLRSLLRHRFFSAINIFGLAVAMTICMGIMMLVADQMSYDQTNSNRDRIYRVTTLSVDDHGVPTESQYNAASTMKVKQELVEKYTGVEKAVRIKRGFSNSWISFEDTDINIPLTGFYADPEVFEVFQYEFQYGDPATVLRDPFAVVLTRKAADRLFKGEENPVGKTLQVGNKGTFTVTGVLKETDHKSHIVFEGLASMATLKSQGRESELENWNDFWNGWTYILLEPGQTPEDIQKHLDKIYEEHIATTGPGQYKARLSLQPLMEITPGPIMNNSIGPQMPWLFVYFFGGLALVILLTSCFNFTNLSIARSLTRAREIGVRKVTGASRWQIFTQFISESIVVALASMIIASGLIYILKPLILQLNFARIFRWDLQAGIGVYAIFLAFAIAVGILAGLFPAAVLSGFQPVAVLKNLNNLKLFSRIGLRKVLLVSQFTLSLFFIISVIVMYNQLKLFVSKDHGFNMEKNIMVNLNSTSAEKLKTELMKHSSIVAVTGVSHVPAAGTANSNGFKKTLDDKEPVNFSHFTVDEDYLQNMEVNLVAGKFFTAEGGESNKNNIVINMAGVKKLQYATPLDAIGEELIHDYDSSRRTIIGVIADYNHRDLTREIGPMALMYGPEQVSVLQIRYAGTHDQAAKTVEKSWAVVNPGLKVDYKEIESEINQFYDIVFGDLVKVLGVISFLAILISCLGLLGMATYTTETRIKEISIRKVLGSSGAELVFLLSKGFLKMLAMAIVIGIPASYFINNLWLEEIAYHTSIDFSVISIGIFILLLFGVITIGSQTIRATFVKPVDNLKSE